jgi:PIN domain nuclease of toxin-antitoxin system
VASLWEIAIKHRLGKLQLTSGLPALEEACRASNLRILPVLGRHALADIAPLPQTRDPFDRLLLAQATCEGMHLVTIDAALVTHPIAWRDEAP